jgi:PAS domain S-box-containing protein
VPSDPLTLPAQSVVPLEVAIAHLVLCIFIILRRWLNDTTGRLFVAYLFLTAVWNIILVVISDHVPGLLPGLNWAQLACYLLIVLGALYWTFARAFLQQAWISPWGWAFGAIGLIVAFTLHVGGPMLPPSRVASNVDGIEAQTIPFVLSTLWWVIFMVVSTLVTVVQQFRTSSPAHKNRIFYLLIATLLLMGGYGLYLTPFDGLDTPGLIVSLLAHVLLAYSLVVENLLDLGTGMRRVTSASLLALVTVIIYATGIYLVQIYMGDFRSVIFASRSRDYTVVVALVAAVFLTVVYTPIRRVSQNFASRVFLGKHYDYQAVIHNYGHAISNILYLNELAASSLAQISQTLGVDRGALLILDSESSEQLFLRIFPALGDNNLPVTIWLSKETPICQRLIDERQPLAQYTIDISRQFIAVPRDDYQALKALNFEWFVPILKKDRLIGVFALGPKRSGQPYSVEDLSLLNTLADQTAMALENAALFDRLRRNLSQTTHIKNLMNNVFDSIENGVITIDVPGQITLCNRAAEKILGVTSEHCLGQHYTRVLPWLANSTLPRLVDNVTQRKGHYSNYEITSELPERGLVSLGLHLTPLKDARNEIEGVAIVVEDLTETKRLRAVQDMFRRYVSPAVVDRLPPDPDDLRLGGHRQEVTILFADIRDFTAFSESLAPELLMDVLNQYLSAAAASILMYEGTLDKFMGDAVMGIFNAPLRQEDHALRAVYAAAAMQRAIADYHNNIGARHKLSFGVGIHVGEVVVGNVGMPDRMDYTVVGDAVNVAKRIQENAPGGKVLLSEAVYRIVNGRVDAKFYADTQVKGREKSVRTYELKWS